jgi:histidine triad (HIT) family protein
MASGEFAVDKLHEDELVFAIADINPRAPVHLLVIPRQHIPSAREVSAEHAALLARMFTVARALTDARGIGERGFRLAVNVGADGGQSVFHLHMHVLGGRKLGAEG